MSGLTSAVRRALARVLAARYDLTLSALAALAGVAGSYALTGLTPTFLASPVERVLARQMPGAVVAFAIENLGSLGQQLNLLFAVALSVAGIGAFAFAGLAASRRLNNRAAAPVLATAGGWGLATLLTGAPMLALGAGLPAGAALAIAQLLPTGDRTTEPLVGSRPFSDAGSDSGRAGGAPAASGDDAAGGEAPDDGPGTDEAADDAMVADTGDQTGSADDAPDAERPARRPAEAAEGTPPDPPAVGGTEEGAAAASTGPDGAASGDDAGARRREVLATGLSVAGFTGLAYASGRRRTPDVTGAISGRGNPKRLLQIADERSLNLGQTEPLVSQKHYTVDINGVDPAVTTDDWTLSVTGAVDEAVEFTRDELTSMASQHRFVTLRCVGEGLNGKKLDTALWTGIPMERILQEAGPDAGCDCVMLRAADGYFEEFPLSALRPGMLAYGMNGEVLPRAHGYPARALVPGHWGEVNVKWLTEIELLDRPAEGYWEKRGWHGTGPVTTVAKLHHVEQNNGSVRVGGHAYAGTRGVQRVEVSTDGGATWNEARLSERLPGLVPAGGGDTATAGNATADNATASATPAGGGEAMDAWRQWVYEYDDPGSHEVVVRAVDGTGTVQRKEQTNSFPDGATGWVSRRLE